MSSSYRMHTLKSKRISKNMMMSPKLLEAASRSSFRRKVSMRNPVSRLGQASSRSALPEEALRAARRSSSRTLRKKKGIRSNSPKSKVVVLDHQLSSQLTSDVSPASITEHLLQTDEVYSNVISTEPARERLPPPISSRRRARTRERVMKEKQRRMSVISSDSSLSPPATLNPPPPPPVENNNEEKKKIKEETPTKKNTIFANILSGKFFGGTSSSSDFKDKSLSCCVCSADYDSSHSRACVDCGKWYCRKCKKLKMIKLAKKTWSCKTHKIRPSTPSAVSVPDQKILAQIHERVQMLLKEGRGYIEIKHKLLDTFVDEEFFDRHKKKIRAACFEFELNRTYIFFCLRIFFFFTHTHIPQPTTFRYDR